MDIKEIFKPEIIEYYKTNKSGITKELLDQLRNSGNEGKQIALDILDTEKSEDNYYLDAFGNKISFLGDRNLKKAFTQMKLSPIHIDEIKRCSEDLNYFMDNYIKIRTKKGYDFAELRSYQQRFLDVLNSDSESIVAMLGRQSGKSVTVAIFMAWHFNFNHNLNIGICANKGSLAREFLNNIKEMFYSIPMWMRQGITSWSKSTIESELKMRVLTDVPGENSFRGFSISLLCVDETSWIPPDKFHALMDSLLPSQAAMSWKKNIFISTPNGMNHFYDLVEGARKRKVLYGLSKEQMNSLTNVLSYKQTGDLYDVTVDEPSNNHALFEMDWREVPRYNSKGERLDPEDFRKDVETKYGKVYFSQNFACVTGDTKVKIFDTTEKEITIEDLYNKDYRNVLIKTLNGYSTFNGIRKLEVPRTLKILYDNESIEVSEEHRFVISGKEVYAKDLKIGDTLQTESGTSVITKIEILEEPKDVYDVLETEDHTYITNSVVSHNCEFIGSSYTLLSKESLQSLKPKEPIDVLDKKLLIYEEPIEGHKYIMGVDPAKSGADSFSIQVLDVTTFPFVEVAAAKLPDENFQVMPARIYDWATYYNTAFLIIENNEGAGTYANVILFNDLEYGNLYFEKTFGTYKRDFKTKIEPGFRTNSKNRGLILDTFKQLVDNKKLVINDSNTIKELNTFVLKNNKYQADDGCHDDMIMAMCIALAPFADIKNFDNFAEMVSKMYSNSSETVKFTDYLCLGNFDDFSDSEIDSKPDEEVFGRNLLSPWSY